MFANNKLMKAVNKPNSCPNPAGRTPVDFIYYTPGVKVEWHKEFIDPSTNDSPHPVMYARMVVPGSKDGSSSQPGSDIVGDDYARECGKYTTCTKQCVDFVKFRLLKHGVLKQTRSLGNGKDVVRTLGSMGYKVNKTPAVHAVMSTAATSTPQWGHTAMVSAVLANGSIIVEEYNYTRPLAYGKRLITASEIKAKNITFAHTEVDYK